MKKYEPMALIGISRYRKYFPSLPDDIQQDICKRIDELIMEHSEYCDKGNYGRAGRYRLCVRISQRKRS